MRRLGLPRTLEIARNLWKYESLMALPHKEPKGPKLARRVPVKEQRCKRSGIGIVGGLTFGKPTRLFSSQCSY